MNKSTTFCTDIKLLIDNHDVQIFAKHIHVHTYIEYGVEH